jgi:lipopolysaccharide/colanic/teichoic acid biosynthesis glycosyltransferase
MKRILDIVLSILALVILSPVLILIMLVLRVTGNREVIFVQERIGREGKAFPLYKFVTMAKGSTEKGTGIIAIQNDPRVLPLGKILRKTKLNELPQLINILKGDMSIIGPRPLPLENYDYYSIEVKEAIGKVRPGLSGVGSIVFRDEEIILGHIDLPCKDYYREHIAPYKGVLEKWYCEHQSLMLDAQLVLLTMVALFKPGVNIHAFLPGVPSKPPVLQLGTCRGIPSSAR